MRSAIWILAGILFPLVAGFAAELTGVVTPVNGTLSADRQTLSVHATRDGWNQIYRTPDGYLKADTDYVIRIRHRAPEGVGEQQFFHILARPYTVRDDKFDTLRYNFTPGREPAETVINFTTGNRPDYSVQIHCRNKLQAEITSFEVSESPKTDKGDKVRLADFGADDRFELNPNGAGSLSDDRKTLIAEGKTPSWNWLFRTRPGTLKANTAYQVTFRYRTPETPDAKRYLQLLSRPHSAKDARQDLLRADLHPTTEFQEAKVEFLTDDRADGAFQIHCHGQLKAEITDFKLIEKKSEIEFIPIVPGTAPYRGALGKLPSGAQEFEVEQPRNTADKTVNASEFGVNPENEDNVEAFNRALEYCVANNAAKLVVDKGVYRMTANRPVLFRNLKDFVFDGQGSTFVFYRTGKNSCSFQIEDCERIVFRNFNFDWDWEKDPLGSVVEVAGVDGKYTDYRFVEYERFPRRDIRVAFLSTYDPKTRRVGGENAPSRGGNMMANRPGPKTEWLSDNVLRIFWGSAGFAKGQIFRMQHYYYDHNGIEMRGNRHLTLEDINIYSAAGHALTVNGHQQYWQLKRVNIAPPEGVARRPITCTADHLHFVRSNGFFKMEDCEFSGGADDCLNAHDLSTYVTKSGPRSVRTRNSGPNRFSKVGEVAELRFEDYSPTGISAPVKEIRAVDEATGQFDIFFDCDLPEPLKNDPGFILFDRSYGTRNIIIRNNKFHSNRARGLLLLASDVTVENNLFFQNEMGAIKIETGYTFNLWSEGYGASNIVIRNNTFDTVNPSGVKNDGKERDIFLGVYRKSDPSTERTRYPILSDILFEGNTFKDTFGLIAFISSAGNVTFRDNTFLNVTGRKSPRPYRGNFFITDSQNIKIVNNRYIVSPHVPNPGVLFNAETSEQIVVEGNTVVEESPGR